MADLRHAVRGLARAPVFTGLAVMTLAVGIGAATSVFSLAEALLLRPLSLEASDRLIRVFSTNRERGSGHFSVSYPDYADFAAHDALLESSSLYVVRERDIAGGEAPERLAVASVDEDFFQTLGSDPLGGRLFTAADHDPRSPATALIAESFWDGRFGREPTLIGGTIRLDGERHVVIGVIRDGQGWPREAQVWTPLQWGGVPPAAAAARSNHQWQMVGRLAPGVDVDDASDRLAAVARVIYAAPDIDERDRGTEAIVVPLHSSESGEGAGRFFLALTAAVLLVVLISCMNASGLVVVRAAARAREMSLRGALGAPRSRLVWIATGESLVLSLVGGLVGVAAGHWALSRAFATTGLEGAEVRLNPAVLTAGIGITLVVALLAGLGPALRSTRLSIGAALQDGGGGQSRGRSHTRLRRTFVAAEIACSLALLVCAGLAVRGFQRQMATDPGFDASNLLSFTVRLPGARYDSDASTESYFAEATSRLSRLPGVTSVSVTSLLPLGGGGLSLGRSFVLADAAASPDGPEHFGSWVEVDHRYFATLGVDPVAGRTFDADDRRDAPPVAMVNERLARQMSPDESMVGRRIHAVYDENVARTVVGVVPDIQLNGVSRAARQPLVLVPSSQSPRASMAFLVRMRDDPLAMAGPVRSAMAELDADVALDGLQTLREAHETDLGRILFLTRLFGAFGLLALLLAVGGVYGLVSYSVAQRSREIGVRMAMGASAGAVTRSVLWESAVLAAAGLPFGLGLAFVGGRVLASGMDGIVTLEPSTYAGTALVLVVAVVLAAWGPARRAARVDPMRALRAD
jgi:predicted permease